MKRSNELNWNPGSMLPMDASVYTTENGMLVVDFDTVKKRSHCRDVIVRFNERGLTVLGLRANWDHEDGPIYCATHLDPKKVKEEYVEWIETPVYGRKHWWNLRKRKVIGHTGKYCVKLGWVELRETNVPFHVTVSDYKVWWKTEWQ